MMHAEDRAQALGIDQDDPDWMDWDDDEPEMLTGYEVVDMIDRPPPVDSDNSLENQPVTPDNGGSPIGDPHAEVPDDTPAPQPSG